MVKMEPKRAIWVKIVVGVGKGLKEQTVEISGSCTVACVLEHVCWAIAKKSSITNSRQDGDSKGKSNALLALKG